jgi:hypothetical protein
MSTEGSSSATGSSAAAVTQVQFDQLMTAMSSVQSQMAQIIGSESSRRIGKLQMIG